MSLRDALDQIEAKYAGNLQLTNKSFADEFSPINIAGDALWGMGSLIGIEPPESQKIREAKYPITTFVGSMLGFGGPYAKAFALTKELGFMNKAIESMDFFGGVAKAPIKTAMVDAAARTAAVEGARMGVNFVTPGGQDIGDQFGEALLNVGLGAGLAGGFSMLSQAGKRAAPLQEIFKDIDLSAAPQVQMRQLGDAIKNGTIPQQHALDARNKLAKLGDVVRTQKAPAGVPYVNETLQQGGKRLNRIFASEGKPVSGLVRKRFARTATDGFHRDVDWQAAAASAGLPENWTQYAQYPRHISFKHEAAAKRIQSTVYQTMQAQGDGWYMTREMNDGLYVMAKRIKGNPTKPAATDEWFFTKTDRPGAFRPAHQAWNDAVADHMLFLAKAPKPKGPVNDIYDSARLMQETLPLRKYVDSGAAKGSITDMGRALGKVLGVEGALAGTGEVTKRVKDFLVEHLAPTVNQFGRNPRAGRAFAVARSTYDAAESIMRRMVYGEKNLDLGKTPLTHVFGKPVDVQGESIKRALDTLNDKDVTDFWNIIKAQSPLKEVEEAFANGQISKETMDFAKLLDTMDKDISNQIIKVEAATGGGQFKPKEGHYMMTHRWNGDNRVALRDAEDNLIGVAAGESRVGAQRAADKLLAKLESEGKSGVYKAEEFDITQTVKLPRDLQLQVNSPAWRLERQNVRGFQWDDTPFTKKELLEELAHNVGRRTKYMAERTVQDVLADDIARVAIEDPVMHKILVGRLGDLAGQQTPAAKLMNAAVDSVLGPIMGKNTASKIVATTNKLMWHLELGGLRAAYPVMNMLTFIQTTMPEIAYVTTAKEAQLAKYYDVFTMKGRNGSSPAGILSPIKLMWAGTKQMKSKDPAFIKGVERGLNEGVIDPRFIEEFGGETQTRLAGWKEALQKPEGFTQWMEAVSEYLPAQSEKFSRLQSFATGWVVGKELLGAADNELLYRFAKQFTERTMYRYGMDARPRLFTTPAGSALGLFKNWMMHYVGQMLDYTAEGAMRNNWAPLLWQTAGTAAVGGAAATPIWAVANGLSNALTGKSALVNGYEFFTPLVGEQGSDAIMFGLPSMLGVSLTGSATAPFANPMRDASQFFSLAHWDRMQAAQKFFAHASDHAAVTGEGPFADPNTRDMFFRAFAPKTMYRMMATLEDGVINSLSTSNPVLKNVGPMEKVWFSLGFNPTDIEKAYAVADELWADQAKMKAAVQRYGEGLAQAYAAGDQRSVEEIAKRAMVEGVDLSSVERSALSRLSKDQADMIQRQFKPEEIEKRMAVLGKDYEKQLGQQ